MDGRMFDGMGTAMMWGFGILGAIVGLVTAGVVLVAFRLFQDHWR